MRKTKTIKIDDREITIRELKVKDIRKIINQAETDDFQRQIEELLPLATDLALEDMNDMAPSELKLLWEAFREVNSDFLALAGRLGISQALRGFLQKHLTDALADLSNAGMSTAGSTDSASS
jgi:hypothetical protein